MNEKTEKEPEREAFLKNRIAILSKIIEQLNLVNSLEAPYEIEALSKMAINILDEIISYERLGRNNK